MFMEEVEKGCSWVLFFLEMTQKSNRKDATFSLREKGVIVSLSQKCKMENLQRIVKPNFSLIARNF